MNIKEIKEMINLMKENDLVELELEKDGLKIRLKKNGDQIQHVVSTSTASAATPEISKPEKQTLIEIKSPMVGTFYRAPSPESEAFVDIDSEIQPGQVICIIEAMKLMNEIKAEVKGRIKEILAENGHPVEYGQVLFRIEPV